MFLQFLYYIDKSIFFIFISNNFKDIFFLFLQVLLFLPS